jgi:hypothetical protein
MSGRARMQPGGQMSGVMKRALEWGCRRRVLLRTFPKEEKKKEKIKNRVHSLRK